MPVKSYGCADFRPKSVEQIRVDLNLALKDFYEYLQIRHFKRSLLRTGGVCMGLSELENIIVSAKSPKKLISKIYVSLVYSDTGYDSLKLLW